MITNVIAVKELKEMEKLAVTEILKNALEENNEKYVFCEDVHNYVDSQRRFHSKFEIVEKYVLSVFEKLKDHYQKGDSK